MVTNPKQVTLQSLRHAYPLIESLLSLPGTSHLVVYEDIELFPMRDRGSTTVAIGPGRTYKTLDEARSGHLGETPGTALYATHFVDLLNPDEGEAYE